MLPASHSINTLAADSQALDKLRYQAKQAPDKALKSVAQQFETVFLDMMLKSMRAATPQDGMFDSEQTRLFTGMLDQQLAQEMSRRGVGLADLMVRQLGQQATPAVPHGASATPYSDERQSFVNRMLPHAERASRTTGIPAQLLLGQAALESGWGKHEIRQADGSNSYNLFGIKADQDWHGKVAEVTTTEYRDGIASRQVERFRAYASYAEAFADHARLLGDSPRYAGVLAQQDAAGFAQALQQAGYATDPHYADKLERVIGSINTKA
ncbi:MAG: flagellar assembly peptidoglycan hydrolase FlgJ [Sideroxydans sp.]